MGLPFTSAQFFDVFAEYNRAYVAVAAALWLASVGALTLGASDPARWSRALSLFLSGLWLWNAVVYHALLFTRINPAAWLFAALFAIQAVLFVLAGTRLRVEYFSATGWMRVAGLDLVLYALAYPFVTMATGHRYPATPTFGVPCPTDILTIGLLITAAGRVPLTLAIIPIVWAFIGGSAAVLLSVATDYALLAAGVLLTVLLFRQRMYPWNYRAGASPTGRPLR